MSTMAELQHMLSQLSPFLEIKFEEDKAILWYIGDDYGKSEAEIAELEDHDYYQSARMGEITFNSEGSITAFGLGHKYEHVSLIRQLNVLVDNVDTRETGYTEYVDVEIRLNGQIIEVDVVLVEFDPYAYADREEDDSVIVHHRRVVGQFSYDSKLKALTGRPSAPSGPLTTITW